MKKGAVLPNIQSHGQLLPPDALQRILALMNPADNIRYKVLAQGKPDILGIYVYFPAVNY